MSNIETETVNAEVVKQYRLEDFTEGLEPYEEVYRHHENPFEHKRAIERMSKIAKSAGFPSFKGTYNEYLQSLGLVSNDISAYNSNPTEFTGQPIQLEAGKWKCGDGGVSKSGSYGDEICACHHPILPTEILENVDTGEEKLKIAYRKRSIWRELIVPKSMLYNSRKIIELASAGVDVTSESAKYLVSYIQDVENLNANELPVRKSVGRLGYINGQGFSPYVDGLIFDGDASFSRLYDAVREHGSYDGWLSAARECRGMSLTARIMLAASFGSVLLRHIGALPFFVHLWGIDSSTGKTVALMLASSVWGDPELGHYTFTFNSTKVGHEMTAAFLNDLPYCLDELQLVKGFDVYSLAQGVGKTRGTKTGGIRHAPTWKNCMLTTGETPLVKLSDGAGAQNRAIEIECTAKEKVIYDGKRISGLLKRNYGFAGKAFVRLLEDPAVLDRALEWYGKSFERLNMLDTTDKQAMAAAVILAADRIITDELFRDGEAMTPEQMARFLKSRASVSTGERGYRYMCDWVALNSNKFRIDQEVGEVYGVIQDGWAFVISSVFRAAAEKEGFSSAALISYLKSSGLIKTRGKNNTRGKRINGTNVECIVMKLPDCDAEPPERYIDVSEGIPF